MNNKVILITGAGTGLGSVIAERLADKNFTIYGTYNSTVPGKNNDIRFIKMNITSDEDCQKAVKEIIRKEKKIDIIINNAASTLSGPTLDFSVDDFQNLLNTNVVGPFRLIKTVFGQNVKPSLIINITSLNGFLSLPNFGLYCASKFAIEGLGLALHYELAKTTRVINLAPGAIQRKESTKKIPHKTAREKFPILNWLMPLGSPEKIADKIEKLIQSDSNPPRVLVGRDTEIIYWLQKVLPFFIFDKIVFFIWKKK